MQRHVLFAAALLLLSELLLTGHRNRKTRACARFVCRIWSDARLRWSAMRCRWRTRPIGGLMCTVALTTTPLCGRCFDLLSTTASLNLHRFLRMSCSPVGRRLTSLLAIASYPCRQRRIGSASEGMITFVFWQNELPVMYNYPSVRHCFACRAGV